MTNAAQFGYFLRTEIQLEQAQHLCVAILFYYINALMPLDKLMHIGIERKRPQAQIIGADLVLLRELIAALANREVASPKGNDSDLRRSVRDYVRLGHQATCR